MRTSEESRLMLRLQIGEIGSMMGVPSAEVGQFGGRGKMMSSVLDVLRS